MNNFYKGIDAERVLIIGILSISLFLFIKAFDYQYSVRVFPQITSGVAIIGSILLLTRGFQPSAIRNILYQDSGVGSDLKKEMVEDDNDEIIDEESQDQHHSERPISNQSFTAFITIGYVIVGYLIGLLWATPLMIGIYGTWFRLGNGRTTLLALMGGLLAYLFMVLLGVQLDEGMIMDVI